MTCPIVPDFIFKMFEQEVTKINTIVIEKMCEVYKLDIEDAKAKMASVLNINFHIVGEQIEQIKVIKKHKHPKASKRQLHSTSTTSAVSTDTPSKGNSDSPDNDVSPHLCEARVFVQSELATKRCARLKKEGCSFCKQHQKFASQGRLKYGTITDEKPEEISSAKLNMMVKRTIY